MQGKLQLALEFSASLAVEEMPSITQLQWQIHFSGGLSVAPGHTMELLPLSKQQHTGQPGLWM